MTASDISHTKIAIIGGCGHVGLPLGIKFALTGFETFLVDINPDVANSVNSGKLPFLENGGESQLKEALKNGLQATTDASICQTVDVVIFTIGTPVDEHLNPKMSEVFGIFGDYYQYFQPNSLIIMRSTLFPGTMDNLHKQLLREKVDVKLAFCPERVSQGHSLEEIDSLPQIISAFDEPSYEMTYQLFATISPSIIKMAPLEAELAKLMANSWRYLEFAIANQFYMIAEKNDVDFNRIYQAIRHDYPRSQGYKKPGFAAGPCLFKDTMQLASFYKHQFYLGHSAMLVNEGLAGLAVDKMVSKLGGDITDKKIGILGMTFKADSDDIRESLSFKVKKDLEFRSAQVMCHDPYLNDSTPLDTVLSEADGIILGTPHSEFKALKIEQPLVDVWGFFATPDLEILPGRA